MTSTPGEYRSNFCPTFKDAWPGGGGHQEITERHELLAAHREATASPFPELVREMVRSIGKTLMAYIAGVKDVRALEGWMEGGAPYKNTEDRLRLPIAW